MHIAFRINWTGWQELLQFQQALLLTWGLTHICSGECYWRLIGRNVLLKEEYRSYSIPSIRWMDIKSSLCLMLTVSRLEDLGLKSPIFFIVLLSYIVGASSCDLEICGNILAFPAIFSLRTSSFRYTDLICYCLYYNTTKHWTWGLLIKKLDSPPYNARVSHMAYLKLTQMQLRLRPSDVNYLWLISHYVYQSLWLKKGCYLFCFIEAFSYDFIRFIW